MEIKPQTRCDTAQRRREIALAARQLIADKGFEGLRTRDIAERVGINIATLHYHVPSKEALIELLAQSLRDEFIARQGRRRRDGVTSLDRLRLEFADFRDIALNDPALHVVMTELADRARRDEKVAAVIRPMQLGWRDHIAAILAAGRDDGSLRPDLDPEAAATMIIGAMINARRHDRDIAFLDRVTAQIERALTRAGGSGGGEP